jgi:hypothetical protein
MRDVQGGAKVYWTEPDHDGKVQSWIAVAMKQAERELAAGWQRGVGVIDFADCTVVVLSDTIPLGEVFVVQRKTENSILHGGFGAAPFRSKDREPDFTANLTEVKNPDAKSTTIGVSGLKKS